MPPLEFEPTVSAGERPQTYALDRAASGTGTYTIAMKNSSTFPTQHKETISVFSVTVITNCCVRTYVLNHLKDQN